MHCGSPSYAAPEIVARREYDGPPVDVWSAGVVLFAMVTGYLPFHAPKGEKQELCRKIMKGAFTTPESCARDFRDLVANILRVDPAKRATFAQVLESKWMRAHASASPGAGGAPGADRVPHGGADDPAAPRRYPARVGGGTAGAAALDESRVASLAAAGLDRDGAFYTLVPIRPRSRGERRSLRTFPGASLRPSLAFNPRPRCLSTPPDAFQLHPDIALYGTALKPS